MFSQYFVSLCGVGKDVGAFEGLVVVYSVGRKVGLLVLGAIDVGEAVVGAVDVGEAVVGAVDVGEAVVGAVDVGAVVVGDKVAGRNENRGLVIEGCDMELQFWLS